MSDDAIQTLRTIIQHRDYVRSAMLSVQHDLERRALVHDISKLSVDEFDGFTRINRAAREHPYGSDEYRAGLRQEKPTIDLHYSRNTHHPECHKPASGTMGFLDIIEMVCDWRAAYLAYGSQGSWAENMQRQRDRFGEVLSAGQWWLVEQVAGYLVRDEQ